MELIDGPGNADLTTTEFGWHAGGGLEVLPNRHFGIHGDYRYTFLDFGKNEGLIGGLIPGHRGSMWTLGATVYFLAGNVLCGGSRPVGIGISRAR